MTEIMAPNYGQSGLMTTEPFIGEETIKHKGVCEQRGPETRLCYTGSVWGSGTKLWQTVRKILWKKNV